MKKSQIFISKLEAHPNNILFRFSLGQALYDEGATAASIQHLEMCSNAREDWMLPRILLGKALLESGRTDKAKPILETALKLAIEQSHTGPAEELRGIINKY